MNIGIWALRVLVDLGFVFAGYIKLVGKPRMIAEFKTVGLGQWFRYFTGTFELIGDWRSKSPGYQYSEQFCC